MSGLPAQTPRSSLRPVLTKIFHVMDNDGDGSVSEAEGLAIGRALAGGDADAAAAWWADLLRQADTDKSGALELSEWIEYATKPYLGKDVSTAQRELEDLVERLSSSKSRQVQQEARKLARKRDSEILNDIRKSLMSDLERLRNEAPEAFASVSSLESVAKEAIGAAHEAIGTSGRAASRSGSPTPHLAGENGQVAAAAFARADTDGNGSIDRAEFHAAAIRVLEVNDVSLTRRHERAGHTLHAPIPAYPPLDIIKPPSALRV